MSTSAIDLLVAERRKLKRAYFASLKRGSFIKCGAAPGSLMMVVNGEMRDVGFRAESVNRNGDPFGSREDIDDLTWRM